MPFYAGRVLDFGDVIPRLVLSMLAQIHAHFEENYSDLDYVPVAYADHLSRLLETATQCVSGFPRAARIMKDVENYSDRIFSALSETPMTLLQGDVHPGNIIQHRETAVLVDWGNARIGPRVIDLANITATTDDAWAYYVSESERFGARIGPDRMLREHVWASGVVNMMYLSAGTQAGGEKVAASMAAKILRFVEQL